MNTRWETKVTLLQRKVALALGLCAALAASVSTSAGSKLPLHVKGYQAALNVLDLSDPQVLKVQFDAAGGVAHLGKMTSQSLDQQVEIATGVLTATVTFTDENGDDLVFSSLGSSAQQPDGRATFAGELTVISGTGRFANASGKLTFDGWARPTDFVTLEGIGFYTIEGDLYGIDVKRDAYFSGDERGSAVFGGVDFDYNGSGNASHIGRYAIHAQSVASPFNGAFVGIVNGKFTLAFTYSGVWTDRGGHTLLQDGIEFVYFEIVILPDGSPAPDFSKSTTADAYDTFVGGPERFEGARGVSFTRASFTPTSQTGISAQVIHDGYLSLPNK